MNIVTDSMSRAKDCAEGGTMADGTVDTEKIIATETCVYQDRKIQSQVGFFLNC